MIKRVLKYIKIAYNNKAYFSALALTLTIPDIRGKIQYKNNSNLKDREKYIKWFDEWIKEYFEIPKPKNEMFEDFDVLAKSDGEVCYALRCAYLYSGNYDLKAHGKDNIKLDRFELCVSDGEWQFGDAHGCSMCDGEIEEVHRRFNVINLIEAFIDGMEEYIKAYGDTSNEYATMGIIII